MNINLNELSKKETELFNSLVQLGDTIEVAYQTVINDRERQQMLEDNKDFYRFAYES